MDNRKYIFAFFITVLIFGTALFVSDYLAAKKVEDVKSIEDRVALDILSTETQFSLLEETSCKNISPSGFLSSELGPLGERLSYAENQNFKAEDVDKLKRSYFLLEIKDYLLMKRVTEKCGIKPTFVLYFYSNERDCEQCETMGAVLTALRERFPSLRVYSFDYDFDLPAVETLTKIYRVERRLPALIVNGDPYYGFRSVDELITTIPALARLEEERKKLEAERAATATSTATSTNDRE